MQTSWEHTEDAFYGLFRDRLTADIERVTVALNKLSAYGETLKGRSAPANIHKLVDALNLSLRMVATTAGAVSSIERQGVSQSGANLGTRLNALKAIHLRAFSAFEEDVRAFQNDLFAEKISIPKHPGYKFTEQEKDLFQMLRLTSRTIKLIAEQVDICIAGEDPQEFMAMCPERQRPAPEQRRRRRAAMPLLPTIPASPRTPQVSRDGSWSAEAGTLHRQVTFRSSRVNQSEAAMDLQPRVLHFGEDSPADFFTNHQSHAESIEDFTAILSKPIGRSVPLSHIQRQANGMSRLVEAVGRAVDAKAIADGMVDRTLSKERRRKSPERALSRNCRVVKNAAKAFRDIAADEAKGGTAAFPLKAYESKVILSASQAIHEAVQLIQHETRRATSLPSPQSEQSAGDMDKAFNHLSEAIAILARHEDDVQSLTEASVALRARWKVLQASETPSSIDGTHHARPDSLHQNDLAQEIAKLAARSVMKLYQP